MPVVPAESLSRLIDERLSPTDFTLRGDHDLNPDWGKVEAPVPAAVLLPIIKRGDALSLLLIHRSPNLSAHAGQISFPGGRIDPGETAQEAALREAEEEVGIKPSQVRLAGRLEPYLTKTGFVIDPFVGWIDQPYEFTPNPGEVRAMFELPMAVALDPDAMKRETVEFEGRKRAFYSIRFDEHYIWGATAGILKSLRERLSQTCES